SAAVLAIVATNTQPKYSPNVPSVTNLSVGRVEILVGNNMMRRTNTTSNTMITISLANTLPACTTPIQAAFNSADRLAHGDRKSTRLNSSHVSISYAVFCLK